MKYAASHSIHIRNKALESNGAKPPKATSTGTTIVGVVFKVRHCKKDVGIAQ